MKFIRLRRGLLLVGEGMSRDILVARLHCTIERVHYMLYRSP